MFYDNVALNQMYQNILTKGKVSQEDISSLEHIAGEKFITSKHKLSSFTLKESKANFDNFVASMESYILETNKLYTQKLNDRLDIVDSYKGLVFTTHLECSRILDKMNYNVNFNYGPLFSYGQVFSNLFPDWSVGRTFIETDGVVTLESIRKMKLDEYIKFLKINYEKSKEVERSVNESIIYKTVSKVLKHTVGANLTDLKLAKAEDFYKEISNCVGNGGEFCYDKDTTLNAFDNIDRVKIEKSYNNGKEMNIKSMLVCYIFNNTLYHTCSDFRIEDTIDVDKCYLIIDDVRKIFTHFDIIVDELGKLNEKIEKSPRNFVASDMIPSFFNSEFVNYNDVDFEYIKLMGKLLPTKPGKGD